MYLLDTNACIRLLNNSSPALAKRLRSEDPQSICLCAVTKAELIFGAQRSARPAANRALLDRFFSPYVSIPFDDLCAEHYAVIRDDLSRRGQPIGPNDYLIAAIARAHNITLVTHNIREFSRVVGIKIEDWE